MNLIVGCGYLGSRVARLWCEAGKPVAAITRSAERAGQLEQAGIQPLIGDVTDPRSLMNIREYLSRVDTVLYAVGFDRAAGRSMSEIYVDGLKNVLNALPDGTRRFIYISTTGVYGQSNGEWIDEESPCEPTREGGNVALAAEQTLQQHWLGNRAIILRCAGIYGPGRVPRSAELLAAKAVTASPDGYLNLIHVEDAARVVLAVEEQIEPPRLYLVSDGHPVRRRDYYTEAARLLGAPPPVFAPPDDADFVGRRGNTDRRVSYARLRCEVSVRLEYPSYREGLAAILGGEQ